MKYSSQYNPLTLDLFKSSFDDLNKTNRWVILGDKVPWAEVEKTYNSRLGNKYKGAGYAMMANSNINKVQGYDTYLGTIILKKNVPKSGRTFIILKN